VASSPSRSHLGAGLQRRRDKTSGVVNAAGVRAPPAARTRRGRMRLLRPSGRPSHHAHPSQPPGETGALRPDGRSGRAVSHGSAQIGEGALTLERIEPGSQDDAVRRQPVAIGRRI
jgi:hypothetical protein